MSVDRFPSFRWALVASVGVPLAIALVLVGVFGWFVLHKATDRLSRQFQHEVGLRVTAEIQTWLDDPQDVADVDADLLQSGLLPFDDDDALEARFMRQLEEEPTVSYVQIGRATDGSFVGVERNEDDSLNLEVTDHPRTRKLVYRLGSSDVLSAVEGYDARDRPWYQTALETGAASWSPIYQFSSRQVVRLGLTAVEPVHASDGSVIGVVGADLVLSRLCEFLGEASPSEGSRLLLVERDGMLVASSVDPPFEVGADRTATRLHARDAPDALSRGAVAGIDLASLAKPQEAWITAPVRALVYAAPIEDPRGLDWVLLVATPASDLTGDFDRLAGWIALFTGATLMLAFAIGAIVARRVAEPLEVLSIAADALANGDREAPLPEAGTWELASLAVAFGTMRDRLAASLDAALRAQRSAEIANRAKSTFLANMSHELRTPLNAVVGYTELMLEATEEDVPSGELRTDLERVRSSAGHLLGLINDLLDLARIESGRSELKIEPVPVGPVLREVADALRPEVERRGNRFEVEVGEEVAVASADRVRLRQVVINLVGNAAKFTENGRVRLEARIEGRGVVVRVSDTGIGIDEQHLVAIFQPFVRLDTTDGREGAGLGLAIVARLVSDMGGQVSVTSALGRGTEFTVVLPHADEL